MGDFTTTELQGRISRLQQVLTRLQIDLAILNQNPDLYYFTGSVQPLYLLVPVSGAPLLLARKALAQIESEVPWLPLEQFSSGKDLAKLIEKYRFSPAKRLGLACDTTSYATVLRFQQLFPGSEVADLAWELRVLRMVKSPVEIAIQQAAGKIMAQLPQVVRENFRPGMTELELSAALEHFLRSNGHSGLIRCRREASELNYGLCAAGTNLLTGTKFDGICSGAGLTAAVPYGASSQPIPRHTPVMLDYALNLQGYHVDQTRMLVWGEADPSVSQAYQAMQAIETELIRELRPGVSWGGLYEQALHLAVQAGYAAQFMGLGPEQVRFVGHGVGLELDELPFIAPQQELELAAGMVLALEPKVALAGVGVIGIEDTIVVRESGGEVLTTAPPELIRID